MSSCMSAFHFEIKSKVVTSNPWALYTAPTEPIPQNRSRSLLGLGVSPVVGGNIFVSNLGVSYECVLCEELELVLLESTELPRIAFDRVFYVFDGVSGDLSGLSR